MCSAKRQRLEALIIHRTDPTLGGCQQPQRKQTPALLYKTSVIDRFRLEDDNKQLKFHNTTKKNCSKTIFGCVKESNIFSVIDESDIYIRVQTVNVTLRFPFSSPLAYAAVPPRIITRNVEITAHLQYIRNQLVE